MHGYKWPIDWTRTRHAFKLLICGFLRRRRRLNGIRITAVHSGSYAGGCISNLGLCHCFAGGDGAFAQFFSIDPVKACTTEIYLQNECAHVGSMICTRTCGRPRCYGTRGRAAPRQWNPSVTGLGIQPRHPGTAAALPHGRPRPFWPRPES